VCKKNGRFYRFSQTLYLYLYYFAAFGAGFAADLTAGFLL
jgi:hypothetical protein